MTFQLLQQAASPYAGFPSLAHHVAHNSKGFLVGHVTKGDSVVPSITEVRWYAPDFAWHRIVYSTTLNTNSVFIEAASTGEFFVLLSDYVDQTLVAVVWSDIETSMTPTVTTHSITGEGKASAAWDDAANVLYFCGGQTGYLTKLTSTGAFSSRTQIVANNTNIQQYSYVQVTSDGVLHYFWLTLTDSLVHYRGVQYAYSEDQGATWKKPGSGSSLSLPIASDESGASLALMPTDDLNNNTFLNAAFVDATHIHIIYSRVPGVETRFFNNLDIVTNEYRRFSRSTGAHVFSTTIEGSQALSGALMADGSDLLYVSGNPDEGDIVIYRLPTGEIAWVEDTREAIPGYESSDEDLVHYVNCARSLSSDRAVGIVSRIGVSPEEWGSSEVTLYPADTDTLMFRITV